MTFLDFFRWMEGTPLSVGIRESTLLFPVIEGAHVLALALSVGLIVILDMRLLGWGMRGTRVSSLFKNLRPWALFGFGLMFLTGFLLFWSEPVKCVTTTSFLVKTGLLGLAGLNAFIFDRRVYPAVAGWDQSAVLPFGAKFAGAASMALWFAIIFCGRWTAYF